MSTKLHVIVAQNTVPMMLVLKSNLFGAKETLDNIHAPRSLRINC
jgi:hypothetical protein